MSKKQGDARSGALQLLRALRDEGTPPDPDRLLADYEPGARAGAQRLSQAVLRHIGRADAVLAPHLARPPRPNIRDVLRLGVTEMLALGTPAHGAVNAAVNAARRMGPKGRAASGMVNAVLRKAASAQAEWDAAAPQTLPDWLRDPITAQWGAATAAAIEAAHEAGAPLDFTAKPGAEAPGDALPTGSSRLQGSAQISALPGYETGDWWVQDAAAALAVRLLDPQPGEEVLDLCAAPGGKTLQLAAAGARVTAVDISAGRLKRLRANLQRCGLQAEIVTADALEYAPATAPQAILLDAPCSASGTIRRHPELPLIRDGEAIADLAALQMRLIDRALSLLAPGGRLVFATCSLLPAEAEDQLAAALTRHPDLRVIRPDLPGIEPEWITAQGGLRLRPDYWPDRGGMDGFFIACLHKPSS